MVQGLVLVLAMTQFGFPALAASQSTREIAGQALAADRQDEPIVTYHYFHHTLHYYSGYRIAANIVDAPSLIAMARQHAGLLVVTEDGWVAELESLAGVSVSLLGEQGRLRLLRITPIPR